MDLLSLREELETLLVDELGTYRLANGAVTPAISVRAIGELSPAATKVTGLECIINRQPVLSQLQQYVPVNSFRSFTLYLVNWGGVELADVAEKIMRGFPMALSTTIQQLQVPEGTGPRDQMRVTLKFNPEAAE